MQTPPKSIPEPESTESPESPKCPSLSRPNLIKCTQSVAFPDDQDNVSNDAAKNEQDDNNADTVKTEQITLTFR
jgi:hypothetical protein